MRALEHCIIELCKKHVISLCTLILSLQPSPQNANCIERSVQCVCVCVDRYIDSACVCCVDGEGVRNYYVS
jgi:hypothetical protein